MEWQSLAMNVDQPKLAYKRLRVIGCLAFSIPPGHQNKLAPQSIKTVMIGYEKNSNACRLWDPVSCRVIVSNYVTFNEDAFPLRESDKAATKELTILNDESWDEAWDSQVLQQPTHENHQNEKDQQQNDPPHQKTPCRPQRQHQQVEHFGNLIGYLTTTDLTHTPPSSNDNGPENDEPSYSKAIKGPNRDDWISAMSDKYTSLQLHSVGQLVEPPPNANILPGMWRLKRKCDEFGRITKYKARWVAGGNHQIKGVDFDLTYASVDLTETLQSLYAIAAFDNLEIAQFDIETAFLNGKMKHRVFVQQVTGFRDPHNPSLFMELDWSLYGTCQAHREFNEDLDIKLKSMGFTVCPVDNSLYTLRRGEMFIHIPMHVDDGMAFSNSKTFLNEF